MARKEYNAKEKAMKGFGNYLAMRRRELEMRQTDLAKKLGVSQQSVSIVENNAGIIQTQNLYELNAVLDLDCFQILKMAGKKNSEILAFAKEYR